MTIKFTETDRPGHRFTSDNQEAGLAERRKFKAEWNGGELRRRLDAVGCSQARFARILGVTKDTVSLWCLGKSSPLRYRKEIEFTLRGLEAQSSQQSQEEKCVQSSSGRAI